MFFDCSLQTIDIQVIPEEDHLALQFILGIILPGPQGQKGMLPVGAIKVLVGKEVGVNKGKELLEAAEALPDPPKESGIIIPGSAEEVEQVAQVDKAIRDGEIPVE